MKSDDSNKAITKQEGSRKPEQNPDNPVDEESEALAKILPEEIAEDLKSLPPNVKESLALSISMMERVSSSSSLSKHIKSEHIDKIIDYSEKESEREHQRFNSGEVTKRYSIGALLGLIFMVLVYSGVTQDKQLSEKIITAGIGALGGFGAGYAVGKRN